MSRQPFRPQVNSSNRPAAETLEALLLSSAPAARDWDRSPAPLPAAPSMPSMPRRAPALSVAEVIEHHGGVQALADRIGLSVRQVQRWRAGTADPSRGLRGTREAFGRAHDEAAAAHLAEHRRQVRAQRRSIRDGQRAERRTVGQQEWGAIAQRHGGTHALAAELGRHPRTVERWVSGEATPKAADQAAMARLDRRYRVAASMRGTTEHGRESGEEDDAAGSGAAAGSGGAGNAGSSGLRPDQPVYIRASGHMVAEGYYSYQRQIGVQGMGPGGMHELPPEVAEEFYGHMVNGDQRAALDALQAHLSVDYAQCSSYDADDQLGAGVHMQTIDEFEWTLGE